MSRLTTQRAIRLRLVQGGAEECPEPQRSDVELVAALRRSEPTAAADLHDRLRPVVMGTVRKLIGDSAVHDDLAQVALMEILSTISRFRADCSLERWASRVAAHVSYKHLRRRRLERRIFDEAGLSALAVSGEPRPEQRATLRGLVERIRGHLAQMDPGRATAFLLHDACGYDLKEVAEITRTSVSASQTRLVRGRKELHERIRNDPELAGALEDLGDER